MDRWIARKYFRQPERGLLGYAEALLLVGSSTLVGLLVAPRWGTAPVDLIYLPAVLGTAILAGIGPALAAAMASALAYNYFFTAPYHTFRIHSAADIVTVLVLFLVAAVTSQLTASMRKQAQLASEHAVRNATIAGLARRLLSATSEREIAETAVEQFATIFAANAAFLTGPGEPHPVAAQPPSIQLTPSDKAAAAVVFATGEPAGRGVSHVTTIEWQIHPVCAKDRIVAAIALARDDGSSPVTDEQSSLLGSLLDQIALALDRARLESEAREFATLRERDRLRSTLLASIGEDLQPPVAAIGKAAGDLRRGGTADRTLVSAISSETSKLQRYLANLGELGAPGDHEPIEAGGVTIDLFNRTVRRDGAAVHLTPKEYSVLAELAKCPGRVLSHAQLLRTAWGPAHESHSEYLRAAIRALRQKLERDPTRPRLILNEPSVGYRLAG